MEVYSRVQWLLGRKTAGSMLQKYESAYKRERACDRCIYGGSQDIPVSVLAHGSEMNRQESMRRFSSNLQPKIVSMIRKYPR